MEFSSSGRTQTSNFIVRDNMEYEWSRDIESYYILSVIQLNSYNINLLDLNSEWQVTELVRMQTKAVRELGREKEIG
jgi:hypothetical protein